MEIYFRSLWELIKLKIDPFLSHLRVILLMYRNSLTRNYFHVQNQQNFFPSQFLNMKNIFIHNRHISTFLFVNFQHIFIENTERKIFKHSYDARYSQFSTFSYLIHFVFAYVLHEMTREMENALNFSK